MCTLIFALIPKFADSKKFCPRNAQDYSPRTESRGFWLINTTSRWNSGLLPLVICCKHRRQGNSTLNADTGNPWAIPDLEQVQSEHPLT